MEKKKIDKEFLYDGFKKEMISHIESMMSDTQSIFPFFAIAIDEKTKDLLISKYDKFAKMIRAQDKSFLDEIEKDLKDGELDAEEADKIIDNYNNKPIHVILNDLTMIFNNKFINNQEAAKKAKLYAKVFMKQIVDTVLEINMQGIIGVCFCTEANFIKIKVKTNKKETHDETAERALKELENKPVSEHPDAQECCFIYFENFKEKTSIIKKILRNEDNTYAELVDFEEEMNVSEDRNSNSNELNKKLSGVFTEFLPEFGISGSQLN